ncbi:MAG: TetR/AcrR family transcriptional regulator [Peptococcaceae bacterium]
MDLRVERTLISIRQSFIELVLTVGFDKVTVRALARKAGINPKTFYDHYADKYHLADQLAQLFLDSYKEILNARFQTVPSSANDLSVSPHIENLLATLVGRSDLRDLWLALRSIHFDGFDFEERVSNVLIDHLQSADITRDPLELSILSACSYKTMAYYFETGETFSIERQKHLVELLKANLVPAEDSR